MISGDLLTVSASGSFSDKNAGSNKTVTLSSTYAGADLGNYSVTDQTSTTATITPKALTVSGLVADSRVYDGTTTATVSSSNALLSGLLAGDAVTVSATGIFADKNVGTNKVVTLSSSYSGADVGNYAMTDQASSSANITPKALTISGITAANKTYDGTNTATIDASTPTRTGLVNGDVVNVSANGTFSDENVANGKTVTLVSSYSGADAGNYTITGQASTTANVTPLNVTLAGDTGVSKVYDTSANLPANVTGYGALSSTSASVLATDMAVSGGLTLTGAPVFDSANAGNRVVQQGSVTLGGSRAGNYRLVWSDGSGSISKAPLTVTANDDAKFYSEADTAGYNGVRYAGFVGGQTSATAGVLGGTLAITRDRTGLSGNNTQDSAGTYSSTLLPSGITAANYDITFVAGKYTIVPVGQLLVKLQNITSTYGDTPSFVVTSARYMSDNQANPGAFVVTNLLSSGYVSVSGNSVTITDGSSPKAKFDVDAVNGTLSSAGHLKAGAYTLGSSVIYNTSSDFTNTINIVGAWQVNQKGVTVNPTGVTKVYDGSAVMSNLALAPTGLVTPTVSGSSDQVSVTGNGNFVDKNVTAQADKTYTLSSLALTGVTSFGATVDDSSNYFLSNGATYVGNDGQITPRTLNVTYGGVNKVYDGLISASVTATDDRVTGDALTITRTAEFGNKNVGVGKTVYVSGVSLSGADASNYIVNNTSSTTANITPRTLVVGYSGTNKVYDGTTSATVTTSDDRVAGDVLTIARNAAFADKNVGGGKTVSVSGVSLSGADADNYSVTATGSTTANITSRSLSVTYAGNNKVYDGGTVATVLASDDRVLGDTLTINRTAAFSDKNVGNGKAVAVSGVSLSGTDADNYTVVATGNTTADITPKSLSVTYGGVNKVYDGTTAASVTTTDDRVSGDAFTVASSAVFSDKNAAVGKTVSVSGVSLSGADADNYTVSATGSTTADITPRALVVSYAGDNKVYDGGTVATVASSDDRIAGDTLTVVRTAAFADKNVGSGKSVSVTGVSLTGSDSGNYTVSTTGSTTADITPRTLAVTYTGINKVYDGLLDATVSTADDRVTGDVISIARTATYADKDAAIAKPVSVFGVSLSGTDAANYSVAAMGSASADITPRTLTPVFTAVSKIYDGSTNAEVTSTDNRIANDVVAIASTANFDTRHVGTGKTVTISGLSLSGADAGNYTLATNSATTTSRIDQAASATWVGGTSNDWMDAANWAMTSNLNRRGVLPDGGNVDLAIFPSGFTGTVITSGNHNHAGRIELSGGTLSVSSDAQLGAVPASVVADSIILSGGTLKATADFSVAANRGMTLGTSGGNISLGSGITLNYLGEVTGAGALNKDGAGTLVMKGLLPYTGATTISDGSIIIRHDAPSFATSSFSGNGTLTIEPVSSSFAAPVTIGATQMPTTLGALTIGKSGNTQSIILEGSVGTVGAQRYYGPVQVTGRNIGLTTVSGDITMDAIDADGTPRGLTLTAGGGANIFLNGDIGNSSPLYSLSTNTSNGGVMYFGGRTNTVYDQIFSSPVRLTGDATVSSSAGAVSFKGTVDGAYGLTASLSTQGRLIFNYTVGGVTPLGYLSVGANGLTYVNADVTVAGAININNSIILGVAGVAQFNNGNFESDALGATVISGWNAYNSAIRLGVDSIGGYVTPTDLTYPISVQSGCNKVAGTGCDGVGTGFVMTTKLVSDVASGADGSRSVEMYSNGTSPSFGIVRGPYIVSAGTVSLAGDDKVSFKWKAQGGSDAFDVYGYLLDVNSGRTIELLNATGGTNGFGATAPWTASAKILATGTPMAEYKFVFVSGTWDQSGGRALGAKLFIDSVTTSSGSTTTLFGGTVCTTCRITSNAINFAGNVNLAGNTAHLNVATDSVIAGSVSGTGGLVKDGAGALTLTGNPSYTGATTLAAGSLKFQNNVAPGTAGFSGAGAITIEPSAGSSSFASDLNLNYTYGTNLTALTIGKAGNTANITTNAMTVAGPIRIYGGNVTVNGAIRSTNDNVYLNAAGTVTDGASGYVSANSLALLGGAVTLDHASNSVSTLAASGVSSLTYSNAGALTIGRVNPTGITATGDVRIETLAGDITVTENISTTSTTANAILLNAGKNTAAGTSTGGNIIISGTPTFTAGSGGTIRLMSGSLAGSTGLADLVGFGTGGYRYNSDEATTNYTWALSPNIVNAIYREQPTATANVTSHGVTYGFDHTLTLNNLMPDGVTPISTQRSALNGDANLTGLGIVISGATYSTANKLNYRATPYTMLDGLAKLGYAMNQTGGSGLTVDKKSIDLVGLTINNKVYDGNTSATFGGAVTFNGVVGNDVVSYTSATGTFASRHVGAQAVTVTNVVVGGADQANYTVNLSSGNGTASISQLASATWVGTGNGNWSDASNWAVTGNLGQTGVIPDGSNVALAIVPSSFTGVLTSSTNHGHAGKIQVNGGTLAVSADTHLGAVPVTAVADKITLNGGSLRLMSGFTQLHENRGITLGANDGTIMTDSAVQATYGGVITGAADFIKSGNGSLALSGAQTFTGTTTITGTLSLTGSGSLQSGGTAGSYASDIINNGQLVLNTSVDHTLSGLISGSGSIEMSNTNTLTLSGANTYSGGTTLQAGVIKLDQNSVGTAGSITSGAIGTGNLVINDGAAMDLNGQSVLNVMSVAGEGVTLNGVQSGVLYNTSASAASVGDAITLTADSSFKSNQGGGLNFASTFSGPHAVMLTGANNTLTHATPFLNTGSLTLGNAANDSFSFPNGLTVLTPSDISVAGSVSSNNAALSFGDANTHPSIQLLANTSFIGNTISFASTVSGAYSLTIADSGATTLRALNVTGDVAIITANGLQFDNTTVGGALSVTTGRNGTGGVSQVAGSTMTVAGNAVFTADTAQAQDAALNNAGNDFQGTVAFRHANNGSWRDVAIVDSVGSLALADVSVGTLTLQANGNVTQTGPLVVTGAASIDAGTGTVTLSNDANDFGGTLTLTAASATIVDGVGGLELGNVQTTVGSLSVRSDRGAITQAASSSIVTAGQSSFTASLNGQGTAAADIELANAGNDFGGVVNIDGAAVSVVDTGALQLGDVRATGNLAITAAGNVSMDFAQVGGTMNVDTGGGDMTLGQVTVTGNTAIATQGGNIAQTAIVQLQSDVSLDAGTGSITLSNPANSFGGQLALNGGSTTIANTGNLTLGTVYNRGSLTLNSQGTLSLGSATTVQGDLTLNSHGALDLGTANIDGSLSLNSGGGDVTIGSASVANNFSVVSGGGAITQTAAFNVSGTANFDAGSGSVDLSNAGNNFVGAVSLTAGTATIADSNALVLGTLAITGNLNAQAQGDLTLGSGQVGGTLTAASSSGNITQQPAGLAVSGQMDLTANTGNIVLDAVANSFDGTVNASAAWVELRAASALTLGTLLATDAALVESTGLLTLGQVTTTNNFSASGATGIVQLAATSLNIGGETSFVSTGGDVVLDQPANQFAGAMTLEANAATVQSASALILGNVTTLGDLTLQTSGGPITQAAAATITANGKTTLVAKQGSADAPITLANTGNNFVGAVAITGGAVKLRDDTGSLKLGNVRTSGMLDAMARGGPIMFEPGTLQLALGGMILTPDPRPSGIDFPKVRPESLASSSTVTNTSAATSTASSVARAGLTVMATDQTAGNSSAQGAVIKISEAPLWQATRNVIPVGKVVALDTSASNNRVIASASFEIVDGFASGTTTIEMGGGQAVPASVDNSSGKVTLNGARSVSDYDKAIRDIKLRMNADVPPNAVFRIKITLTDQSGKTESKTVTLQVNQPEQVSSNP
jgi:autotransporter-associated beta strand protein